MKDNEKKNGPLILTDEGIRLSELAREAARTVIEGSDGPYDAAVLLASFTGSFALNFSDFHWDAIKSIALTEQDGENYKKVSAMILALDELRTASAKVLRKAVDDGVLDKEGNVRI